MSTEIVLEELYYKGANDNQGIPFKIEAQLNEEQIKNILNDINADMSALQEYFENQYKTITDEMVSNAQFKYEWELIKANQSNLENKFKILQINLENNFTDLQTNFTDLQAVVENLISQYTILTNNYNKLQENLQDLRNNSIDYWDKIAKLEADIEDIKNTINKYH